MPNRSGPVDPPPTWWDMRAVARNVAGNDDQGDMVAIGADLEPGTLLAAYRSGLFPMPSQGPGSTPSWWSPVARGVLPLDALRVSRSLRRSVRGSEVRVDTAFADVVAACGDPSREGSWIDGQIATAYRRLHELGWAHSVETWREGRLVGGLYGVAVGGLFAGESMFHRETDASKVALVHLVGMLAADGDPRRLLDVQWLTRHLASLGAVEVPRETYLQRLAEALEAPLPAALAAPGDATG